MIEMYVLRRVGIAELSNKMFIGFSYLTYQVVGDVVKLIIVYMPAYLPISHDHDVTSRVSYSDIHLKAALIHFSGDEKLNLEEQMGAIYKLVHTVNKFTVSLQALSLLYQVSTAR